MDDCWTNLPSWTYNHHVEDGKCAFSINVPATYPDNFKLAGDTWNCVREEWGTTAWCTSGIAPVYPVASAAQVAAKTTNAMIFIVVVVLIATALVIVRRRYARR